MANETAMVPAFGGQGTVGAVPVPLDDTLVANAGVQALVNLGSAAFSGYPLAPGTDVAHDNAADVGALAASDGIQAGELVKAGTFSVTAAATGDQTDAITFTTAFPTACDAVLFGLSSLGTAAAAINGGPFAASISKTGFTATLDITTAGTGNVTGYWVALGH